MSLPEGEKVGKPKLSVEILRQHRILFVKAVHNDEHLDNWLRPIRQQLIPAPRQLLGDAEDIFDQELKQFWKSGQDWEEAFNDG